MTDAASSSAETSQASIPADGNGKPAAQESAATNVRRDAVQSIESLVSSGRPLAELLEEAKQLVDAGPRPEPDGAREIRDDEKPRPGEMDQETSGGRPNDRAQRANRFGSFQHTTQIWRRARLQGLAALGATVIGYAFGHVVAENDRAMRFFFAAAVAMGLFFVFSALATHLNRRRRKRLY
jgi:hypothetical protein